MKLSIYQTILPMALAQQTDDSPPMVISLFDHMTNLNLGLALEHQPSPIETENDQSEDNSNVVVSENDIGDENVTEEINSEISLW